jgi:polygalacturonase
MPCSTNPTFPRFTRLQVAVFAGICLSAAAAVQAQDLDRDFSPQPEEEQVTTAMHSEMELQPQISVGPSDADIIGNDHRALQAAVDYISGLGGGLVEVKAGEYEMRDSLHLRSHVTVRGDPGKTVLRKAPAAVSDLALDGDFGEEQITLQDGEGFAVGSGVAIWDKHAGGFHTTVARITGQRGNTFSISRPLNADCMVTNGAKAATVFPVISGYNLEQARVENLTIDGNKSHNVHLNGCRGAGIFLYRGFGTVIRNCQVQNYHGDGISFQQSNDVTVTDCVSEGNSQLGLHPGSGSQRPIIRGCIARNNGTDGLFLCWRVRHGRFEDNILAGNGRYGISIGHKDSDNLLRHNHIIANAENGVYFRPETVGMAAHRNRLIENTIENNGQEPGAAGIRIRGHTNDLVFTKNIIRDTRPEPDRTQTIGIQIDETVGPVELFENEIRADQPVVDRRQP